ncbi:MAG: anthranilate phosphoribosyltransferase [Aigarchaeota archaeon]|nr:anthranilate phosphoribosyltransferase [Aigarchaeota archaeon]
MIIVEALKKLVDGLGIDGEIAASCMEEIMDNKATPAQISAFLIALRLRGEDPETIASMARVMRRYAIPIKVKSDGRLIDTCGTGGDRVKTINVSTASGIIVAACGGRVAKHGNRSFTGFSGSADFLEEVGVKLECQPETIARCIENVGFGFIYAPSYHPSMKNVAPVRREISVRTIFNILGPLTNPAPINGQVLGVFSEPYVVKLAEAMKLLGIEDAIICHGAGGIDEFSIFSKTITARLENGSMEYLELMPEDFGLEKARVEDVIVGSREEAVKKTLSAISGIFPRRHPLTRLLLMNSSAALLVADLVDDYKSGVELAWEAIASGRALKVLTELVKETGGDPSRLEVLLDGISREGV